MNAAEMCSINNQVVKTGPVARANPHIIKDRYSHMVLCPSFDAD